MRLKFLAVIFLLCAPAFSSPLEEFIKASVEYSPEVKAARQAYIKAGFDKLSSFSAMLPSAGVSHNRYYSWGDNFKELSHETYAWLNQPLFQGFTLSGRAIAASINEETALARMRLAEMTVSQNAARNYYAYVAAALEEKNQNEAIEIMKGRLKELKRREAIGKIRASDRVSMETALLSAEASVPSLKAAVKNALLKVRQSCGCGIIPSMEEITVPEALPNTNIAEISVKQPQVVEAQKNVEAAKTAAVLVKGTFLPYASINMKRNISDAPAFKGDLTGMLSIQWSLFEGGERVFNLFAYEAALENAVQRFEIEKQNAYYAVASAYNIMEASSQTAALMKEAAETAEKARKMKEDDYRIGIASNLEVISAMSDELEAKRKFTRAAAQAKADRAVFEIYASAGGEK